MICNKAVWRRILANRAMGKRGADSKAHPSDAEDGGQNAHDCDLRRNSWRVFMLCIPEASGREICVGLGAGGVAGAWRFIIVLVP